MTFPNYPSWPTNPSPWPAGVKVPNVVPFHDANVASSNDPSRWQWSVNGQLGALSGSYGSDGGKAGVALYPAPITLGTDGSVSVEGTLPILGPVGVTGSAEFAPYTTTISGGSSVGVEGANISIQGGYQFPYGYQNATDWGANQLYPIFGPLNDYRSFSDPFMDSFEP